MTDQSITSLIEKLEAGPVYLTHKEAYDLAIWFGSDAALGLAQAIRKAFAGGSFDAALALAERVLPGWEGEIDFGRRGFACIHPEQPYPAHLEYNAEASTPALALCAAILRAKSGASV